MKGIFFYLSGREKSGARQKAFRFVERRSNLWTTVRIYNKMTMNHHTKPVIFAIYCQCKGIFPNSCIFGSAAGLEER